MRRLPQEEPIYLAVVHLVESDDDQKEIINDNIMDINEDKTKILYHRKYKRF